MALVNVLNINILNNPAPFAAPLQFEVTFECLQELQDDLEWKVVYVGNAEDSSRDQVLEDVAVGPVPVGLHRFVLQAPAPDPQKIKNGDLIGVTVILITCSYLEQPFVQVGYYVNNEYALPFEPESYPNPVDISKLSRSILAQEPRVTRYAIDWTNKPNPSSQTAAPTTEGDAEAEPDEDVLDLNQMEDEEDEDEDEDEEDGDVNREIDLGEDDEEGEEGEDEAATAEGTDEGMEVMDGADYYAYDVPEGAEILHEDTNSIDISRMVAQ